RNPPPTLQRPPHQPIQPPRNPRRPPPQPPKILHHRLRRLGRLHQRRHLRQSLRPRSATRGDPPPRLQHGCQRSEEPATLRAPHLRPHRTRRLPIRLPRLRRRRRHKSRGHRNRRDNRRRNHRD
ncbi:hypothetical protein EII42_12475, partial [Tessaracoccus sp. OH4464_COT-324]